MPNYTQPEADKYCDGSTEFNIKKIKESRSTKMSEKVEIDYSIPGKKMPKGAGWVY